MKVLGFRQDEDEITLSEIIIVVGILTILFALLLVVINPSKQFALSKNKARSNDVNALINAIHLYVVDNNGILPSQITTNIQNISSTGADLCPILVANGRYLSALPQDPSSNNGTPIVSCPSYNTYYTVKKDAANMITVTAPRAEDGASISISR